MKWEYKPNRGVFLVTPGSVLTLGLSWTLLMGQQLKPSSFFIANMEKYHSGIALCGNNIYSQAHFICTTVPAIKDLQNNDYFTRY
ncbi:MAG: hypothetical protein KAU22_08150 [Desulfuromonadales bacterium]|nr:hypothetical protein [Desulfuromonadales bacterium]